MTSLKRSWPVLVLCGVVAFNAMSVMYGLGALFTGIMDTFGVPRATASLVQSLNNGLIFLCGIFTGHFLQRLGPRVTVITGSVLATAGCVIAFFATHIVHVIVGIGVLGGIGMSLNILTTMTVTGTVFHDVRSLALSIISLCIAGGSAFYPPVITYVTKEYSLRGTFLILAAINCQMILCGALIGFFIPRTPGKTVEIFEPSEEDEADVAGAGTLLKSGDRDELTGDRDELTGDRDELTGDRDELTGDRDELTGDRDELTGDRDELTGDRDELTGDRDELTGDRDELTGDRDELTGDRDELTGDRDELTGDRDELTGDRDELTGDRDELTGDRDELTGDRDEFTSAEGRRDGESTSFVDHAVNGHSEFNDDGGSSCRLAIADTQSDHRLNGYLESEPGSENVNEENSRSVMTWCLDLHILRDTRFVVFAVFGCSSSLFFFQPLIFMTDIVRANHLTAEDGAFFLTIIFIGNVVGRGTAGILYKLLQSGTIHVYDVSVATGGVMCLLFLFTREYSHFVAVSFFLGINYGIVTANFQMAHLEILGPERYTIGLGYASTVKGVFILLAGPYGGLIRDLTNSYKPVYYVACVHGLVAGSVLLFTGLRCRHRS